MRKRVLVTGAVGYIASQLLPAFRKRYELTLLDVARETREGKMIEDIVLADLSNPNIDAYRAHFQGVDAVVHLAYHRPVKAEKSGYYDERTNVDMAHNVYQVSFEEGVERVVMASSIRAVHWYEGLLRKKKLDIVYPDTDPYADSHYGWAKIAYEKEGFIYACGSLGRKMGVVLIRISAPREIRVGDLDGSQQFRGDQEGYKRDLAAYISERDLQQLFCKSIEKPNIENQYGVPFQIFFGTSNNSRKIWSITNARKVVGYEPEDDSEVRFSKNIYELLVKGTTKSC